MQISRLAKWVGKIVVRDLEYGGLDWRPRGGGGTFVNFGLGCAAKGLKP